MEKQKYLNSVNLKAESNFPYLFMDVIGDCSVPEPPGYHVMHWHDDFQFIYVISGHIDVHTLNQLETIKEGEAVFINKNVVHEIESFYDCHYKSIVFPEHLVEFYIGGPAKKYVASIAENSKLSIYLFRNNNEWNKNIFELLQQLIKLEEEKSSFYEYEVLVHLSRLWLEFIRNIDIPIENTKSETVIRMEKFLKYIEQYYNDDLSLEKLARSANVSKSECLRCFKCTMKTTPYKYLIEYRLQQATIFLQNTNLLIGEIAEKVGFHQVSHFGKCFKEKTGYSPKKYRNNIANKERRSK